jgi:hypothetical protein
VSMRRVWLVLGVSGVTAGAGAIAAAMPGCTTRQCSSSSYSFDGGRMRTADIYETNDWNERWLNYPGETTVNVHFPAGMQRQPITITGYIGTSDTPNGGVDFQGGQNWSLTAGQLAEGFFVTTSGFSVANASCANYFARFEVDFAPQTFLLFGGLGGTGNVDLQPVSQGQGDRRTADTWSWDGTQWTQLQQVSEVNPGPAARSGTSVVTLNGSQYFFGGYEGRGKYDNDFWQWTGVAWSEVFWPDPFPEDSGKNFVPYPRSNAAVAVLRNQPKDGGGTVDKMLLFGGRSLSAPPPGDAGPPPTLFDQNDTWIWDGTTWNPITPKTGSPPARSGASAVGIGDKVVLFGGTSGLEFLGDTWVWDDEAETWTQIQTGSSGPSPRTGAAAAMFATPNGPDAVLFGGTNGQDLDDTWLWDGSSWTQAPVPGPGARSDAALGPFGETLLLFGGFKAGVPLGDFWSWNGSTWQFLPNLSGTFPPPRGSAGASGF